MMDTGHLERVLDVLHAHIPDVCCSPGGEKSAGCWGRAPRVGCGGWREWVCAKERLGRDEVHESDEWDGVGVKWVVLSSRAGVVRVPVAYAVCSEMLPSVRGVRVEHVRFVLDVILTQTVRKEHRLASVVRRLRDALPDVGVVRSCPGSDADD